jgi:hypothetical protein
MKNAHNNNTVGQSTIEFTFAMIVVVFLIYSMVRVFFWVGMDLASRRVAQDVTLTNGTGNTLDTDPNHQLNPNFYRMQGIDAIYNGTVTNGG